MKKEVWLQRAARSPEEREVLARLWDLWMQSQQKNCLTASHFLDAHQTQLARQALCYVPVESVRFCGGYEGAERTMALFYPDYMTPEQAWEQLPIRVIEAQIRGEQTLTHRDFLGALLATGIRREAVGDILVHSDRAQIILGREVADFVLQQWEKAGRRRLVCQEIERAQLRAPQERCETISDTVAALRLDSVVASGFALSRTESRRWIESGRVAVNHCPCERGDSRVQQGDVITLRGKGKILLEEVGGQSRKGRIFLKIKKYL